MFAASAVVAVVALGLSAEPHSVVSRAAPAACRTAVAMAAPAAHGGIGAMSTWRPEGAHGTGFRFMPLDTMRNEPGPMMVRSCFLGGARA
jgi:hypothetical protein